MSLARRAPTYLDFLDQVLWQGRGEQRKRIAMGAQINWVGRADEGWRYGETLMQTLSAYYGVGKEELIA